MSGNLPVPTLVIGKDVKTIENGSFMYNKCQSIQVHPENTIYDSRDNCNGIIATSDYFIAPNECIGCIQNRIKTLQRLCTK